MFENEAKEYEERKHYRYEDNDYCGDIADGIIQAYQQGAEFGYNKCKEELNHKGLALQSDMDKTIEQNIALKKELNKVKEWHYVKDGDLPEVDNKIVLCICSNGYIDGKRNRTLKLLTRKEFPLFHPIYAWREIVLPETPKEDKK